MLYFVSTDIFTINLHCIHLGRDCRPARLLIFYFSLKITLIVVIMQSIASIVGATLTGKDTYSEWWRKIKSAFIYNDLWDNICEGTTIETAD